MKIFTYGARRRHAVTAQISTPYSVNLGAAASSDKQPSCASSSALPLSLAKLRIQLCAFFVTGW